MLSPSEAFCAYDRLADVYDQRYSSSHILAENRFLASLLRKWRVFDLQPAPRTTRFQIPVPSNRDASLDRRYNSHSEPTPLRQFLDIGCGTGLAIELSRLAEQSLPPERYFGIDPAIKMLAKAREKFPDYTFVKSTAEKAHAWGRFERVVSLFGAFNYADPWTAMTALRACATDLVVLVVYSARHAEDPAYILRDWDIEPFGYTQQILHDHLRQAGFSKIEIFGMSPPAFYDLKGTQLLLSRAARQYFRTIPPDDGCFLVAKARKSWASE